MPFAWKVTLEAQQEAVANRKPEAAMIPAIPPPRPNEMDARTEALRIDRHHSPAAQGARAGRMLGSSASVRRKIDWRTTVQQVARGRVPDPLPVQRNRNWRGHVHIVLDAWSPSMRPFAFDLDVFRSQIQASLGQFNTTVHWLPPPGVAVSDATAAKWPGLNRVGDTWLVFSDAGIAEPLGGRALAFEHWAQQMSQRNHRVLWMAPLPVGLLTCLPGPGWAANWEHALLRRVWRKPGAGDAGARQTVEHPAVNQVLGLLAMVDGAVDSLLLRGLRGLVAPLETSVDWLVWNHPHVTRDGTHCRLRPEHLDEYRAHQLSMSTDLLNRAVQLQRRVQAGLADADAHINMLNAAAVAPKLRALWPTEVAHAQRYAKVLLAQGLELQGNALMEWRRKALRYVNAASVAVRIENSAIFTALAQQALQDSIARGEEVPHFPGLNPLRGGSAPIGAQGEPPWSLVQDGVTVWLRRAGSGRVGGVLTDQWVSASSDDGVWLEKGKTGRWLAPLRSGVCVVEPDAIAAETVLTLSGEKATLCPVARPAWAHRFGQTASGVICQVELPWGERVSLDPEAESPQLELSNRGRVGVDPYGLYLELVVKQKKNMIIFPRRKQGVGARFRYLCPGTFLMGSTKNEGHKNERPQHSVTLTAGIWLADTPCTQALWQAVMGSNPSEFRTGDDAPNRPVENVSHADVKIFLGKLQAQLPSGVEVVLPTEAQWEYAARAGSQAAYWWGERFEIGRANTGGRKGRTTTVGAYEANPWGLYDMHGNVWEWCADDRRTFEPKAEVNPVGNTSGDAFAVRGGSWLYHPDDARAASRDRRPADLRLQSLGFRFALRSSGPGPEGGA
jgi:formylglycine-generating enzyme required for sulfatase activity